MNESFKPSGFEPRTFTLIEPSLAVPDITRGDGIYSQIVSRLFQTGFYSTSFKATFGRKTFRFWPGPSFYVSTPTQDDGEDHIPPSR